ncbi:MAG TPA: hypothetical protein PLY93_12435 [Turneriella sp.]|nr:hypothetical protein [Turneriella sp.]
MKSLSRKLTFLFLSITPLLADNYPTYVITDPTNQAAYTAQLPNLTHKIAAQYQLDNMNNIVRGNANAQAVATTGAGTAYAMGEHTFIVGASGAAAVATSDNTFSQVFDKIQNLESGAVPQFGIGAALSAMVGMNLGNLRTPRYLGPFEIARTTLFVNAMNYSQKAWTLQHRCWAHTSNTKCESRKEKVISSTVKFFSPPALITHTFLQNIIRPPAIKILYP